MNNWLLVLIGFGCVSVLCTLLILGACIISQQAALPHEQERPGKQPPPENFLANFERLRALWRRI